MTSGNKKHLAYCTNDRDYRCECRPSKRAPSLAQIACTVQGNSAGPYTISKAMPCPIPYPL